MEHKKTTNLGGEFKKIVLDFAEEKEITLLELIGLLNSLAYDQYIEVRERKSNTPNTNKQTTRRK